MQLPAHTVPPAQPPRTARPRRSLPGLRTVLALMLREMATTYGRSPGGYLWAILEPAAGILLLTAIFSLAFQTPPLGTNFPLFYATGMVPFMLYMSVSGKMASALLFSRALLAYPTVTYIDALIARFLINMATQLLVAYVIFAAVLLAYDTRTILDLPRIFGAFAMAGTLAAGVGVMNCFLFSAVPVWQQVWSIVNRPLFIISCIFFVFETVPRPYRDYLWYNPLVHIIGETRAGFYAGYRAEYVSPLYVHGVGLALMLAGVLLLRRYYRDLINR